jgi:myotubularin-related protein 6/7/8
VNIQSLYCFQYTSSSEELVKTAGWDFFKLENEFKRMKVPNDEWQLTVMNKDYVLCDTYPSQLFVPNAADKTVLLGSSRFRSKGRLPALTYLHPNKASICRCSQPLSGFSARCMEDEQMLQEIRKTNPNSSILYVVDTRPRVSFHFLCVFCPGKFDTFEPPHLVTGEINSNLHEFPFLSLSSDQRHGKSRSWQRLRERALL